VTPKKTAPKKKARAAKATVKAVQAAPAPAAPSSSGKGWAVLVAAVLVLALVGQSGWVFYRDRMAQVTLHYEVAVAVRGPGRGQVQGARHVATDPQGDVFYLQGGGDTSVLQKFSRDGKWLAWVGPESPVAQRLNNGFAVAGGADGSAWVVERGSGALKHYDAALKLVQDLQLPDHDLTGVAVAPDGSVWVASFAGELLVLKPGESQATPFTGDKGGRLHAPYRLCFDAKGGLYVLDFDQGVGQDPSVKCYDPQGAFLRSWRVKDLPINEFACIAWHPGGYVVLNDPRAEVVDAKGFQLFSPEGKLKFLATLSDAGHNLRSIPAFAISPTGEWFLDLTPMQQGCGRFSWNPALKP
jgi:streptogramin lyase